MNVFLRMQVRYDKVVILCFVFGAGQWVWHGLVVSYPLMLFAVLLSGLLFFWRRHLAAIMLCAFFAGAGFGLWQLNDRIHQQLPKSLDAKRISASWHITSIPSKTQHGMKFEAELLTVEWSASDDLAASKIFKLPQKIQISWYKPKLDISAGDVWQGTLKLKRPRGTVNFGGFDYQAYLLAQGFFATASVKAEPVLIANKLVWASHRAEILQSLDRLDLHSSRFFRALLVADKSHMKALDWEVLQRTGTVHLMAISGLHIGIVATWAFWLGSFFARLGAVVTPRFALVLFRYIPPISSLMAATFYAALADFSIPTLRALVGCGIVNVALLLGRRFSLSHALLVCSAWVIFFEPFAFLNMGFWLSFSAVAILLLSLAHRKYQARWTWLTVQWPLLIGMSFPLLVLGLPVSLLAPVANILAVPLVSLVVVPGLFLATLLELLSTSFHYVILHCIDWVFSRLWVGLEWMAQVPWASWTSAFELTLCNVFWFGVAVLFLLVPCGLHLRGLGGVLAFGLTMQVQPASNHVRVVVMDVGQGLSVVIETPEKVWVYDTGPKFSDKFDAGSRIVAPYLKRRGHQSIGLIVSHDDNDHAGGAAALEKLFDIYPYWAGEAIVSPSAADQACASGQTWQDKQQGVIFEVLWPPKHHKLEGNDASCVVLITVTAAGKNHRILLTGDISKKVESKLLPYLPKAVDFLVSPHHGSRTSSSKAFVDHIRPSHVVHSSGFKHHYGHPHPKVWQRYEQVGAVQKTTAQAGAVAFEVDLNTGKTNIMAARANKPKRWY